MAIKTLVDLFIHDLSDVYSAEKQITRALPKMARAATDESLKAAFEAHLEETRGQIERLDQIVEGLVEEAQEIIDSVEAGPVRDAGLIGAAQKVEHYEIATYGTLTAMAKRLGFDEAAKLLAETLQEEKATDEKLNVIAEKTS